MTGKYEEALKALALATSPDAEIRMTFTEIRKATGKSATWFRQFRDGVHSKGKNIKLSTLDRNADLVLKAIATVTNSRQVAPVAYVALKRLLGTSDVAIQNWLSEHRGSYFCYRFASSEGKIQVSKLDVFDDAGRPRFKQTFKISKPVFGEGKERIHEGDVHLVGQCAHFMFADRNQMYHTIFRIIEDLVPEHMVGIVSGTSTDRKYVYASRIVAVRYSRTPHQELPESTAGFGLTLDGQEEERRACQLEVVEGVNLPTIARLLSFEDDVGVLRAMISLRRP